MARAKLRQKKAKGLREKDVSGRRRKKGIIYGKSKDRRVEWKQDAEEEGKAERKGSLVLFMPPSALVFTFFFPCELFYISDLIKSNKSQCAHIHKYKHTATTALPASGIVSISSLNPLHPRMNKSRLWCITRHIIHVVYRSKICKQTSGIKVIHAQMDPFSGLSPSLTQHRAPSLTCPV